MIAEVNVRKEKTRIITFFVHLKKSLPFSVETAVVVTDSVAINRDLLNEFKCNGKKCKRCLQRKAIDEVTQGTIK